MFDIGSLELLFIVIITLVLFGPERLPKLIQKVGNLVKTVRGLSQDAQQALSKELDQMNYINKKNAEIINNEFKPIKSALYQRKKD